MIVYMDIGQLRERMISDQIISRGIKNSLILEAMRKIPRHLFIPGGNIDSAYRDNPLGIGHDQTISQPYVVAFMTEALDITKNSTVLEIGTGSGYQTAVLAELAGAVYTIERIPQLQKRAKNILSTLGYGNIYFKSGDGYESWEEHAPFDRIIVTAAPVKIPKSLLNSLAPEGILIGPEGPQYSQELIRINRSGNKFKRTSFFPVRFVPMVAD
jgi:protein-L-isoaspartate(D-aspartate) O-methyltransferase